HLAMHAPFSKSDLATLDRGVAEIPPERGATIQLPHSTLRVVRAGFLQMSRHTGSNGADVLAREDLFRFRTIYADALLLAAAQRRFVEQLAEETARVGDPTSARRHFARVATNLRTFRNGWWWKEYTNWRQPDR